MNNNLTSLLDAFAIAHQTKRVIYQNIGLAVTPNLTAPMPETRFLEETRFLWLGRCRRLPILNLARSKLRYELVNL
jgi:hypothetical protein